MIKDNSVESRNASMDRAIQALKEEKAAAGEDKAPAHPPTLIGTTPAPWIKKRVRDTVAFYIEASDESALIGEVYGEANAELIASAPGLAQQLAEANKELAELRSFKDQLTKSVENGDDVFGFWHKLTEQLAQANRDKQELIAVLTTAQKALKPGATVPPSVYAEIHTILNKYTI